VELQELSPVTDKGHILDIFFRLVGRADFLELILLTNSSYIAIVSVNLLLGLQD
jgi:hypothetical protein